MEDSITFNYKTAKVFFQSYWTSSNNTKKSSNIGYSFGSPLIVVDVNNTIKLSPFRVNFTDVSGNCFNSATTRFESLMHLQFGYDSVHTCIGTTSNFLTSLTNNINKIASLGSIQLNDTSNFVNVNVTTSSQPGIAIL